MLTGRPNSKETTTLHWQMPDDAWVHWAQGRGEKSVRDVILDGIDQIRKSPEAVRERCEADVQEAPREHEVGQLLKHEIKIELPASDWAGASQRAGRVSTEQLLRALILESESWQQVGNAETEWYAGYHQVADLLGSLTATTAAGFSLEREEKILARMVTVAAIIGAAATVASAVAAWCSP